MTPFVVSVDEDGTLLVGETAKEYGILGPYFIKGDIAGAIAFMKDIPELRDITQAYVEKYNE